MFACDFKCCFLPQLHCPSPITPKASKKPMFSGARRKFTAEELISLFLTKSKRGCSCGEDKDGTVLARSWRAGQPSQGENAFVTRSFSQHSESSQAEELISVFLTKPMRGCSNGEDKDREVLPRSCSEQSEQE